MNPIRRVIEDPIGDQGRELIFEKVEDEPRDDTADEIFNQVLDLVDQETTWIIKKLGQSIEDLSDLAGHCSLEIKGVVKVVSTRGVEHEYIEIDRRFIGLVRLEINPVFTACAGQIAIRSLCGREHSDFGSRGEIFECRLGLGIQDCLLAEDFNGW